MTVKATIVEKETKSEFPVLMELHKGNVVVLFIAPKKGTVVSSVNESVYKIGEYSETWAAYNDKLIWKPFNGKVVLENS